MSDTSDNPRRLLQLMERLRPALIGPAFKRLHELQLSPSHHRVMRALVESSPLAMKDLAEQLALTPPSVTALVRRLVEIGLVVRRPHAEDSRVALLDLSDAGEALYHELMQEQLLGMGRLLAALSPAEQQTFLALLDRAVAGAGPGAECGPPSA